MLNRRDIIAYFLVAATGALVQLLIGSLSQDWFSITFGQSLTLGYVTAAVVGFFLTKMFAFNNKNNFKARRERVKFLLVQTLSFLITVYGANILFTFSESVFGIHIIILPFSVKTVNVNKLISQLISMTVSFCSNYILHKKFTFKDTGFYDRLKSLLFR